MKCERQDDMCCKIEGSKVACPSGAGFSPIAVVIILTGAVLLGVAIRYGVSYLVK